MEKYGSPTSIGKFPPGWPQQEIDKLLEALEAMQTDSAIVAPSSVDIDTIKTTTGDGGHERFIDKMDHYISKVILGQTMTMEIEITWRWWDQLDLMDQQIFTVAKVVQADILQLIKDMLTESLENG